MPLLIFHWELDFSWPSSTVDFTGWRSDFTVAGTANEFHKDFPPCISVIELNIIFLNDCQTNNKLSSFSQLKLSSVSGILTIFLSVPSGSSTLLKSLKLHFKLHIMCSKISLKNHLCFCFMISNQYT